MRAEETPVAAPGGAPAWDNASGYERPIGPWPRKTPPPEAIRLIAPEEFCT